jgi:hypothetical protein
MFLQMFEKEKYSYFGIKLSCFHMLVKFVRESHRFSLLTSFPDNLMSKSDKFWIYVFSFRKKKPTFIHPDVGDNYEGERNKVVNPFADYVQSTYNNPFPEVFTSTSTPHPHKSWYQDITGFIINSYSEIFVTALRYFRLPFISAVFLNPSKASSG